MKVFKTKLNIILALLFTYGLSFADPVYYIRKDTWQDSLLTSIDAIEKLGLNDELPLFSSRIMRGGDPAYHLRMKLNSAKEMYLFVTGSPDVKWGVADWADAKIISSDGRTKYLSGLKSLRVKKGRRSNNITLRSGLYQKLMISGRYFARGVHVQADSILQVPLNGEYDWFDAWIGVDDWAGRNGSVRFEVVGSKTAARYMLWNLLERDFPEKIPRMEMRWERQDLIFQKDLHGADYAELARRYIKAASLLPVTLDMPSIEVINKKDLQQVRNFYYKSRKVYRDYKYIRDFNFRALSLAIEDLVKTFGSRYSSGKKFIRQLSVYKLKAGEILAKKNGVYVSPREKAVELAASLNRFKRKALLANPLLNFDKLLVIKRKPIGDPRRSQWEEKGLGKYIGMPRQSSWGISNIPDPDKWENEIDVLSPVGMNGELKTLFKPGKTMLVTDVDLNFDADKILFSMPDKNKVWQVCQINANGKGFRQLTPSSNRDVHNYDSCYLPNGDILFVSTAPLQAVPCNSGVIVGMMYCMDSNGRNIHQVCFEQDHDYTPSVMNNGRVLYLRWDYTDTPHVWNRIIMTMNPDGTGQMSYYGSNSYWPNAIFFARAIPNEPKKFVGIVTGHHEGRVGDLVVFDPSWGTHEADGAVQKIPGYGKKVKPLIEDKLTEHNWPKFLHPYPLSDKYFIVSCKVEPDDLWGIYLVDVFDNMTLIREEERYALLEPIPFRKTRRPPVIPGKIIPGEKDAVVYLENVYKGSGLKGVVRGEIKKLRLFTYQFGYQRFAGIDYRVGSDGPWEIKRVLGTVPVEEDGSAMFRIPAKTPVSVQPLDSEGQAVALMRSWFTALPGEFLSCVGCHEQKNSTPLVRNTIAASKKPSEIKKWRGPVRGFSFKREVQPVLDKYCVCCHDGKTEMDGRKAPDLRADQGRYVVYNSGNPRAEIIKGVKKEDLIRKFKGVFEPSYIELRKFVRVGGFESDLHQLPPKEFSADTMELVQMLQKGHYNVKLDEEAWDRLITWIDLNAPCHGTWRELACIPGNQRKRRVDLRKIFGGIAEDLEVVPELKQEKVEPVVPEPLPGLQFKMVTCSGWPFDAKEAATRQGRWGPVKRRIDLGGGVSIDFVRIPAGSFVMGDNKGDNDERMLSKVEIKKPFWMGTCEVTNEQFACFDPDHDSRFEDRTSWIFSEKYLGWRLNKPKQPVVRVSCVQAEAFCNWLSKRIGEKVVLPTEAQWEYACRAGTTTPLFYGELDDDFSDFANLADASLKLLAYEGWRPKSPDLVPRISKYNDNALVTADVGSYKPNAWGLHDMHGNAAEWTCSAYLPYPYTEKIPQLSGEDKKASARNTRMVVRGGSWRDRPRRCRSAFRLSYPAFQRVYNVGFRIIIE